MANVGATPLLRLSRPLLFLRCLFRFLRVDLHRTFIPQSPFINDILDPRHTLATLVIAILYCVQIAKSDARASVGLPLRFQEVTLSQKNVPQGMKIPETFPPELGCAPSPAKDVLKPGIVLERVMRGFSLLLSSPKERVEAVIRVHGDVEMGTECAWCSRCLA